MKGMYCNDLAPLWCNINFLFGKYFKLHEKKHKQTNKTFFYSADSLI